MAWQRSVALRRAWVALYGAAMQGARSSYARLREPTSDVPMLHIRLTRPDEGPPSSPTARRWRGYPGNHRVQLYPGSFCHLMVEVTLPTLCLVCHHEDDVAQAIGGSVHRLAPERRVRPPGTVTRCKRNARECPIPASTHAG